MIVVKVLVQRIIVSAILVDPPQCGLDDSQKNHPLNNIIIVACKFEVKEVIVITRDFNGYAEGSAGDHEDHHAGYSFGVKNKEKIKNSGVLCSHKHYHGK